MTSDDMEKVPLYPEPQLEEVVPEGPRAPDLPPFFVCDVCGGEAALTPDGKHFLCEEHLPDGVGRVEVVKYGEDGEPLLTRAWVHHPYPPRRQRRADMAQAKRARRRGLRAAHRMLKHMRLDEGRAAWRPEEI